MKIPADLWNVLSPMLDEAIALAPADRAAWLAAHERDRPDLAPHLRRLLAAHDRPGASDPLVARPSELIAEALTQYRPAAAMAVGDMLGPYRLVAPLADGGMASVWLAEQTAAVLRRVALKVPHPGLEDPAATARRFVQERDFLAGLEHPHIARLYDAGISQGDVPYLAMEWIDGMPITAYADRHRLTVDARVALFQQVLQAVRFAHARLVIHRDIKPSNILVTAEGEVKLLDFGIARLLGPDVVAEAPGEVTAAAGSTSRAFTPEAASPEQLAGQALATPSDVYSLGVVLYELLCGQRPYRLDAARTAGEPAALHAAVLDAFVAPPSTLVIGQEDAGRRASTPRRLRRALAGDLDAIVLKALMKRPEDRYDGAQAFSADLERWASGQPVEARRAGPAYRALRFVARHRTGVAMLGSVTLALAIGLGVALWQARQARQEARTAQAVQDFLIHLFDANDPQQSKGTDVSARQLLDRGAARLDTDLQDQPAVLARLHHEVGGIYIQLGDNLQARPHLEKSLALYRSIGQEAAEDAIEAEYNLSELLEEEAQYEPARAAAERCLALAERAFGRDNRWRLPVQEQLAAVEIGEGHPQAGVDRLGAALREAEQHGRGKEARVTKARANLGNAYVLLGNYALARDEFARVIQDSRTIPGYEDTDGLVDRLNLARARYNLHEFDATERELADLVPAMDRHIGALHDRTIKARSLWAQTLAELGRYREAVDIERRNLANARARATIDDDVVSLQELTLAKLLKIAASPREGLPLARDGLAFLDGKYPDPTWYTEVGRRLLAELMLEDRQVEPALAMLAETEERTRRIDSYATNASFADLLQARATAARLHARPGDDDRAIELLQRAREVYDRALGAGNTSSLRCVVQVAWLRARRPGPDPAAERQFDEAAEAYRAALPAGHLARAEMDWMRAEIGRRPGASESLRSQAPAREAAARQAWKTALGSDLVAPLNVLH